MVVTQYLLPTLLVDIQLFTITRTRVKRCAVIVFYTHIKIRIFSNSSFQRALNNAISALCKRNAAYLALLALGTSGLDHYDVSFRGHGQIHALKSDVSLLGLKLINMNFTPIEQSFIK